MQAFYKFIFALAALLPMISYAQSNAGSSKDNPITGTAAYADWAQQKPGVFRKITAADMPKPHATRSVDNDADVVARPKDAMPQAPAGFKVELYAEGLNYPRELRTAPNGDIFLAESHQGEIKVFRGVNKDGKATQVETFATGLSQPFGIAFYPPGPNPEWVYVGNTGSVVRFPYHSGDLKATGAAQKIADLPGGGRLHGGGHWTRDIAFSKDGKKMFVSVGSHSNNDDTDHPEEKERADVLEMNPDGSGRRIYAYGIRNAVGIAVCPETGALWGSVNERDELGDTLPPDYITHIEDGGFYGWPWYYIGANWDPKHEGKHPELKNKVLVPDVLVQPHFASLEMVFYEGKQFPQEYRGRPVGVAVGNDGSLFVSDDGSKTIWRVSYTGK